MKIGIITAMSREYAQVARLVSDPKEVAAGLFRLLLGRIGGSEVALLASGIGKVNAALGADALARAFAPDCVISTGVAGGLDPALAVMDVVAGSAVVYHDVDCGPGNVPGQVQGLPPRFAGDARLLAAACALGAPARVRAGLIVSGDRFVTDPKDLAAISAAFPEALAVDMESGAIAQTCHLHGLPFLSFRIVSDVPGADGHYARYEHFWETLADRSFAVTRLFLEALAD